MALCDGGLSCITFNIGDGLTKEKRINWPFSIKHKTQNFAFCLSTLIVFCIPLKSSCDERDIDPPQRPKPITGLPWGPDKIYLKSLIFELVPERSFVPVDNSVRSPMRVMLEVKIRIT
jgi:hypothetical protein